MPDYSLESAICKVSGTEFLWYAANRAMQLRGGEGYMRTDPYEKVLRDIRIFPIFEGANDVMRAFIALTGMKPLGEEMSGLGELGARRPDRLDRRRGRLRQRADQAPGPPGPHHARPMRGSPAQADAVADQVKRLRDRSPRSCCASTARRSSSASSSRSGSRPRSPTSTPRSALISRVTSILEEQGVEPSGQELYIADTFCTRAAGRVRSAPRQIESNDDERMTAIAKLALKRGEYGYALFED